MKKVFVAAMLALVLVPVARAGAPVQTTTPWDRTRVIPASSETCAFAIQVHSSGTIHTWTYSDGTVKTILSNFEIDWTNSNTRTHGVASQRNWHPRSSFLLVHRTQARFIAIPTFKACGPTTA